MNRKTAIAILVLAAILAGGGFLFWKNSQASVRDLNKNLPEGVRVVKSLFGNEYRVMNKIDGYEFTVPWKSKGIKTIDYFPRVVKGKYISTGKYEVASITITGVQGISNFISVDKFIPKEETTFDTAVQEILKDNNLITSLEKKRTGNFDTIKTQGIQGLGNLNMIFFKVKSNIYAITWVLEEYAKEIILTGKW